MLILIWVMMKMLTMIVCELEPMMVIATTMVVFNEDVGEDALANDVGYPMPFCLPQAIQL